MKFVFKDNIIISINENEIKRSGFKVNLLFIEIDFIFFMIVDWVMFGI